MASIGGASGVNQGSLYGSRNVISGLASGMDTEGMIENSISGFRLKISGLQQKQTRLQWQQEAYRGLTDDLVAFSRKYSSYTSSTNLLSNSFFNKATLTTANGPNAEKVSATGKTTSDIKINSVTQLATASRYQINKGGVLEAVKRTSADNPLIEAEQSIGLGDSAYISKLRGNMTIAYGGSSTVSISFAESDVYKDNKAFVDAINEKLADVKISGDPASDRIKVELLSDGKISFSDKLAAGNEVYISNLSGSIKDTFGDTTYDDTTKTATLDMNGKVLKEATTAINSIADKKMTFSLDGITKSFTFPSASELSKYASKNSCTREDAVTALLQEKLNSAFGSGRITVTDKDAAADKLRLSFEVASGSTLTFASDANTALGLNKTESTALNTSKTLGELLGNDLKGLTGGKLLKADGAVKKQDDGSYKDSKGNVVNEKGDRLGKDGKALYSHDLVINGKTVGSFTRDTSLESVILAINNDADAGVSVTYSKTTNQFVFNAKETGANRDIKIGDGLGKTIFGDGNPPDAVYTSGQDAVISMTVNGTSLNVSRSTNTFDVDGMSITLNGTFDSAGDVTKAVSFTNSADSDKIVDAVKSMIEDYNKMVSDLRSAFNTSPAQKSNGSKYQPLTDQDRETMSESAIKNYEEKAKQGILFADRDLSSLYNKLLSAFTPSGADGLALRSMGITTTYTSGLTQIQLDEDRLRETLKNNPDAVRDAFTKSKETGSATDGLAINLKNTLDAYVKTDGANKGILINKAGSKYSTNSLFDNSLKKEIDTYESQIVKLQGKMSKKVDYYTRQFTQLEKLIAQMNEQSSSIMNLMGGGA